MPAYKNLLLIAACVLVLLSPAALEACPTCKDGLSENSMNLVRGFGWSIIFMMSMPFLVLGGIGGYFYLEIRRARRSGAEDSPASSVGATKSASTPNSVNARNSVGASS